MQEPIKHLCTREEAAALVKRVLRKKGRVYLSVMMPAPIQGDPDHVFPCGLTMSVKLTWSTALEACRELLSETMEARGARIPAREYSAREGDKHSRPAVYLG